MPVPVARSVRSRCGTTAARCTTRSTTTTAHTPRCTASRSPATCPADAAVPVLTARPSPQNAAVTTADLFLRNAESDEIAAPSRTARTRFASSSPSHAGAPRSGKRSATPTRRRTSACCSTTPPSTCSGWAPRRSAARSIVGINATYRGAELARLVDHTDCQAARHVGHVRRAARRRAPARVPRDRVLAHRDRRVRERARGRRPTDRDWAPAADDDLYLLIFTSGSTGFPKAVRCTQGRFARTGMHVASIAPVGPGTVVYAPLPFFHTSCAVHRARERARTARCRFGSRAKFSASQTMPDIRRMGAVMLAYTGKVLNYILAVPPSPDDAVIAARARDRQRGVGVRHPRVRGRASTARCATATARPRG